MRRNILLVILASAVVSLLLLGASKMLAQSSTPESMITRAVDETQRVTLRGNVHPMARAEFDQGAVASTMPMQHMLLVLKRSAEQQTALEALSAQQADRNSPNYHKWLTPSEFGAQFGPSSQDMTAITTWLGSHGFEVNSVAAGRNIIDFSGTAGQIEEAFHTAIHKFAVNGENHWANVSDPEIPAALAPLVVGVNSLNDFRPKAFHHNVGAFRMSVADRKATRVTPNLTLTGLSSGSCYSGSSTCYVVAPYDFATIYNLQPLWGAGTTGTGENIAIVSDSNINTADYQQFRTLMGLPAETVNVKLATGVDPAIQMCTINQDEQEAILDVEWAGATAPGATIDLVAAPSAPADSCNGASNANENLPNGFSSGFGGDYAAYYAINTLNDPILSDSYGACELSLGTNGNTFYNTIWQQANTQGITVLTATGDNGSAGCDDPSGSNPAQNGLQVNGADSTPYDTAVGGTDFNYDTPSAASNYWNSSNSTGGATTTLSAKGPIPEIVYNDTCTSPLIISFFSQSSAVNTCNNSTVISDGLIVPVGSSGGFSNCTTPSGLAVSDCAGGYAKPTWQTGSNLNIPGDGKRDLPDVSLFAGDGTVSGTFYLVCEEDAYVLSTPSSPPTSCSISSGTFFFAGEGGTSVSAQAMAGIVALIDQKNTVRLGSVAFNTNMYTLANAEGVSSCNNSTTALANSSTCIFKDVTSGTNSMPCVSSSPNCGTTISSQIVPVSGFRFRWTPPMMVLGVCVFCASMLLFVVPGRQRRWSAVMALIMLAVVFGVVSCGGGGSNGTITGGGGTSNSVGVLSGYNATAGYDRATGLGSVNAANMVNASGW
jgi:subtilase family serine protease